jgi:sulfonate transport system permease protein
MIGANKGIGFRVMNAQCNFLIPLMFGAIFLLAARGLTANLVFVTRQRRLRRHRTLIPNPQCKHLT